jgi:hypothetical protein
MPRLGAAILKSALDPEERSAAVTDSKIVRIEGGSLYGLMGEHGQIKSQSGVA